jgi:predicted RNA-binding Zn-ribbon protein involved in translation (DUF1610 family)
MVTTTTRFKAFCTECRSKVELGVEALRLAVGRSRERTFYSFTCPECGAAVRKPAGERIVDALVGAGVSTMRLHLGHEPLAGSPHARPGAQR